MVVRKVRGHIDGIADSAKGQGSADSKLIGKRAGEKSNDRKSRVQGCVGFVVCGRIQLAAATHAIERIEHARAHEADERDNDQLDWRRGVPWQSVAKNGDALVLPRVGEFEGCALRHGMVGGASIVGMALLVGRHGEGCSSTGGWEGWVVVGERL